MITDFNHQMRSTVAVEFKPMRTAIGQLTRSLLRAMEFFGDERQTSARAALADFHKAVPYGLGADQHALINRDDFLAAVTPAQILYRAGMFLEAGEYSSKVGSTGHTVRRVPEAERHETTARILNDWYIGWHQQNIWGVASQQAHQMSAFATLGMADPVVNVIDAVLVGKPEHAAYSDLDEQQRKQLREWKGKLVPKTLGDEASARLRNEPEAVFNQLMQRFLDGDI